MSAQRIAPTRVTILGTGIMGSAMAERLLERGFAVDVWNRSPRPFQRLVELGATAHVEPTDAVSAAAVAITMLPTGEVVEDVMLNGDVLAALPRDGIWAQMGTIGPAATDRLVSAVAQRRPDVAFVDAPVSGSRAPARNGQLVVLASGPLQARAILDPVFAALGQRTLWLGPAGTGSRLKLVLNTWLAFETEAAAEVEALALRLGIPLATLTDAMQGLPLASPYALAKLAKMASGDDAADFPLEWALKDLDLARTAGGPDTIPVADAIAERWRGLVRDGLGRSDVSAARHELATTP